MKHIYSILLILTSIIFASAQNRNTKKADKHFDKFEYADAAKAYLELIEDKVGDAYVSKRLAHTYYLLLDYNESVKWYAKTVQTTQDAETHYRYAQMLKATGKYTEADKQLEKFAALAPNDSRAKAFKMNYNYLAKINAINAEFTIEGLSINSDESDFGAFLYQDILYFSSAQGDKKIKRNRNMPYLNMYQSVLNSDGNFSPSELVADLNSKFNDGTASISPDGRTIYFSSESFNEKEFRKVKSLNAKFGQLYLYKATKAGQGWENIQLLPFNDARFSCANPSISNDGKTLYFSSNQAGGFGGIDIWKTTIKTDGTFEKAVNLGQTVNTEGDENFPFISDDNKTLFFASNGKLGLGGYDIFSIDLEKNTDAVNAGKPLNSEKDDFGFTFNTKNNIGFFATNRNGNDDIYKAVPKCQTELQILVTNAKTYVAIANADVTFLNEKKAILFSEPTTVSGSAVYKSECNQELTLNVAKDGFTSKTVTIQKSVDKISPITVTLEPIEAVVITEEITLSEVYFNYNKSDITPETKLVLNELVAIMKQSPNVSIFIKSHTDNRGTAKYNLKLSEERANATAQYLISQGIASHRVSGKGYGELEPKIDCQANCTEEDHKENRRSVFLIVKKQ
jgi:outer membrane protein OmpA-like peptidoglycan-associated protein